MHAQAKPAPGKMFMSEFFKAAMVPMGVFSTEVDVSDAMMETGSFRQDKLDSLSSAAVQAAYLRLLRSLHSSQRTPSSSTNKRFTTQLQFATPPMGSSKYRYTIYPVFLHVQ